MNDKIILTPLKKAIRSLKNVLMQPKDEFMRDATIQRFEYTYELSWKLLKRYLFQESAIEEFSIKNLYREAARQNIIKDVEVWFQYHAVRNSTSHNYNEDLADESYELAKAFIVDAEKLLKKLEKLSVHSPKT